MNIGVPKEIKANENRVALTPSGVTALVGAGHSVLVETDAGAGSGFPDTDYTRAGARVVSAAEAWETDLVLKIKEPQASEYQRLADQLVFGYFHLALFNMGNIGRRSTNVHHKGVFQFGEKTTADGACRGP